MGDVKDMKPFSVKGSMQVVCCDVFNMIARHIGLNVYKDHDIIVLVLFIMVFVTMVCLRFRRIILPSEPIQSH